MPGSTDGSSNSDDDQQSRELGHTEASKLDGSANSWSFQAEIRLDLSGAGSNHGHTSILAKVIKASLHHQQAIEISTLAPCLQQRKF
jgi:hypothetical protein